MNHLRQLAHDIAAHGVRHAFGIPGSGPCMTLLDELERLGVAFHLTHFEGSAALMAGAVGRLSGTCGVAAGIKGPGLANMVPGLACCLLENHPLVSITEAYPPGTPARQAHKRLDHAGLVSAVTKGARFLGETPGQFQQLARWAEAEAPGPVHLDMAGKPQDPGPKVAIPQESDTLPPEALRLLEQAQRPLVIAGTLALRRGCHDRLNRLRIPVFSTAAAKGAVDETLPQAAGVYTGVGGELAPEKALLAQADLVVGLGLRHNEVLSAAPFGCPCLLADPLAESLGSGFAAAAQAPAGPRCLESLFGLLETKAWGLDALGERLAALDAALSQGGFLPAAVFQAVASHFAGAARLVLDTGNFCTIGEHAWRVRKPGLYLAAGQGRYMGVGLPQAVGAAVHDPSTPTVLFTGDGGAGMFVAEIKLAVAERLPVLVVLLTDGHLGTILGRCLKDDLTRTPVRIPAPSWAAAYEAMGVPSSRAAGPADVEQALRAWDRKGPLFIEAAFEPLAYQAMTNGIR